MRCITKVLLVLCTFFLCSSHVAFAQEEEEKGRLIRYVEDQLSSPNMQIRLNGLVGSLSSNVSLETITIADKKGVWLTISKPQLVWTRSALLTGRVDVESLTAESIHVVRQPEPDDSLPSAETTPFAIPELPVSVILRKLKVPRVELGAALFGTGAVTSVDGRIELDGGNLDLGLIIQRLDDPGGQFRIETKYDGSAKTLALDVALQEPQNGILASLLGLEGKPPVALSIKGDAPISDLDVDITLDVDERRILAGDVVLNEETDGIRANANLGGPLSSIMPQDTRSFFGPDSRLRANALFRSSGEVDVESFRIDSGSADLTGSAHTLADGFLNALNFEFTLKPNSTSRVILPSEKGDVSLASARLAVRYDAASREGWSAKLNVDDFRQPDVAVQDLRLDASGTVSNVSDPTKRALIFDLDGALNGFSAKDQGLQEALGEKVELRGNGSWRSGAPLFLNAFRIIGDSFRADASGQFEGTVFDGDIKLDANRLAAFSSLLEREMKGTADLRAIGKIQLNGGFDLRLNGTTGDLQIGEPRVDPLLAGDTTLSGSVARNEKGLQFNKFRIANSQFEANIDGRYASDFADLMTDAQVRNINILSAQASGPLRLTAGLVGKKKPFAVRAELGLAQGKLSGRDVENLALTYEGTTTGEVIQGTITGSGRLDSQPVSLGGDVEAKGDVINLQELVAEVGGTNLKGNLRRDASGLIDATLDIKSSDISAIAALALTNASGSVNGTISLTPGPDGRQSGKADVRVDGLRYDEYRIGKGSVQATLEDLFGTPDVDATIDAGGLRVAGVDVKSVRGRVETNGNLTDFDIDAALAQNNARISSDGQVVQEGGEVRVALNTLSLTSNITSARLQAPTSLVIRDGDTRFSGAALSVGSGMVRLNGSVGKQLALNADIASLPLSIVNALRPDIAAAGTLSGDVRVTGTSSDPVVDFQMRGAGLSASALSGAGLQPLQASAQGRFSARQVRLSSFSARNTQNINIEGSGIAPLSGAGLNIRIAGTAPLKLAERFVANRGASISGTARFDATIGGSLQNPQPNGILTVGGGSITDPLSNLKLINVGLMAGLNGDRISITRAQAGLASGGTISASGTVGLTGDLPANLAANLSNARYTDGSTFSTTVNGSLTVTGNLQRNPVLGGTVNLGKTEIIVPETFAADSKLLNVKHVRPSAKTRRTLARLNRATPVTRPTSRPSILQLDLTINAPNRIFVRGRGLDAELGGRIRVIGPVTNVQPVGQFDLRRGRLSILGTRIDLSEGSIRLTGDLDPFLKIVARTDAGDVEAFITLEGRASDLKVTFSSSPELPQDEVLARIIFGRGIGDLSPAQIARLASIAAELTGGNSPGLVDGIRRGTGLDDLDIVQDDDGNAAVKAGKYVSDNVYLGVQAGKETEATINLDITDNLKARGAVNSKGDTSLGLFYEKDY